MLFTLCYCINYNVVFPLEKNNQLSFPDICLQWTNKLFYPICKHFQLIDVTFSLRMNYKQKLITFWSWKTKILPLKTMFTCEVSFQILGTIIPLNYCIVLSYWQAYLPNRFTIFSEDEHHANIDNSRRNIEQKQLLSMVRNNNILLLLPF